LFGINSSLSPDRTKIGTFKFFDFPRLTNRRQHCDDDKLTSSKYRWLGALCHNHHQVLPDTCILQAGTYQYYMQEDGTKWKPNSYQKTCVQKSEPEKLDPSLLEGHAGRHHCSKYFVTSALWRSGHTPTLLWSDGFVSIIFLFPGTAS